MKNENLSLQPTGEVALLHQPGLTLSPEDLDGILSGELEGHYWTTIGTDEIYCEGTLQKDDRDAWQQVNRQLMNSDQNCQYGGMITAPQARLQYRARLWEVWQAVLRTR